MKKLPALLTAILITAAAQAQINKGQFLVGGTGSFKSAKTQGRFGSKNTSYDLNPNIGYFFANKLAGGLRLSFAGSKTKSNDSGSDYFRTNEQSIAPFLRYYVLPANKKLNVFADAAYGIGNSEVRRFDQGGFNFYRFAAGPAFFLTPNVALETTLSYDSHKFENARNRRNTVGVNLGFQIHLGK